MKTRLYLTHGDHGRALSWDEFIGAEFEEGYRYEMIEGRAFVSPAANAPHNAFEIWLSQALFTYAREYPEVIQFVATRARVFLPGTEKGVTAPEPDLACYAEYAPNPYAEDVDWREYSPFLVAEVISADTAEKDLARNRRLYLQVPAIKEYWILDPRGGLEALAMLVYRRRGRRWEACRTVAAGATYTTPLLPGFSLLLDPLA